VSNAARQRAYRARNGARTGEHGPKATAPCGTVSAYKRHLRHGEATCAPCAAAWATYQRERYHARTTQGDTMNSNTAAERGES